MSNEKITDKELMEMLKGCELSDEELDAIAGGGKVEYDNCLKELLDQYGATKKAGWYVNECKHLINE